MENEKKCINIKGNNNTIFNEPVYNPIFCDKDSNVTIKYGGKDETPENTKSATGETPENRESRKQKVMQDITKHFDFSKEQLGEVNGKNLSNDQVIGLFKQCFGIGSHPSAEMKETIEETWMLLIDKRRDEKIDGEDFFPITVMNVLGYFRQKGVLKGNPKQLMKAVFVNAKESQSKNILRGEYHPEKVNAERYPLPEGFREVMNYFIDKLNKG